MSFFAGSAGNPCFFCASTAKPHESYIFISGKKRTTGIKAGGSLSFSHPLFKKFYHIDTLFKRPLYFKRSFIALGPL